MVMKLLALSFSRVKKERKNWKKLVMALIPKKGKLMKILTYIILFAIFPILAYMYASNGYVAQAIGASIMHVLVCAIALLDKEN